MKFSPLAAGFCLISDREQRTRERGTLRASAEPLPGFCATKSMLARKQKTAIFVMANGILVMTNNGTGYD